MSLFLKQRDQLREEMKEIVDGKQRVEKEKMLYQLQSKETIAKLTAQIQTLSEQRDKLEEDLHKLTKDLQMLQDEKEKMRARIVKLRNRKGKVDLGIKTCKNCAKEFHEKNNLNWSCHLHWSLYDAETEMWWCCGKKGKDQKGCTVQKHEVQNEDEEDDDDEKDKNAIKSQKIQKCLCCKQVGHSIE